MPPFIILAILIVGATLGVVGVVYHKGRQSCVDYYEHLSLQNELKNKIAEAKNYQEQAENNELLVGEANVARMELENRNVKLQQTINKIQSGGAVCVDADFLRELQQLRNSSSKKADSRSSK